jgi:hypothetical protein
MSDRIRGFQPEVGIEYIDEFNSHLPALPLHPEGDLTGSQVRDRVEELYPDSHVDRKLREFATPRIQDPTILAPARFESLLREVFATLDGESAAASNGRLSALHGVLGQEIDLRDQMSAMRNQLLKA